MYMLFLKNVANFVCNLGLSQQVIIKNTKYSVFTVFFDYM